MPGASCCFTLLCFLSLMPLQSTFGCSTDLRDDPQSNLIHEGPRQFGGPLLHGQPVAHDGQAVSGLLDVAHLVAD